MNSKSAALWGVLNTALVGAVLLSSLSLVETSHRCRSLYASLQRMEVDQWNLQEQWSRLLLEESTWAAHHRVEQLARQRLNMHLPASVELEVVP